MPVGSGDRFLIIFRAGNDVFFESALLLAAAGTIFAIGRGYTLGPLPIGALTFG